MKKVWITVYKDTIMQHDDDWNLSDIQVTEEFAKQYYAECKKNSECEWKSYEEFMNNFTADDTEDFYKYAREHKAILRIEHMGNIPKGGDGNKKYEIEITYSFDDGIESMGYFNTPEEAYERMCQVAATEAYVQGSEFFPEQDCIVYFHPSEKRIALHYLSDDEWCYYDLKELED